MKVIVDEDKCCGFAACLSIAPDIFDMDGQNIATVLDAEPRPDQYEAVRAAAAACPTAAILIEE
jgi:ferredoxin